MTDNLIRITTHSVTDTLQIGQTLGAAIKEPTVIALTGDLGCGKTAFVQGLAKGLDVSEKYYITSPTFTLINEYPGRYPLFHVDLYRIEHHVELEDVGLDEILKSEAVIAIEWAERLSKDTLAGHLQLRFEVISEDARRIEIFAYGQPAGNLLKALKSNIQDK